MSQFDGLVIGSPVLASQINALLDRAANIARYCPAVMTATTIGVIGYYYEGSKNALPAASGVGYVPCNVLSTRANATLVISTDAMVGGWNPAIDIRPADVLSQKYRGALTKTPGTAWQVNGAYNIWPDNEAEPYPPPSVDTRSVLIGDGSSNQSEPVGVWLTDFLTGTWDHELDHMSYCAWLSLHCVEVGGNET